MTILSPEIPLQRVAVTTLGCKTNQFESAALVESLGREGFLLVPFEDEADIYVINTCTVTAKTDAESRKLIRRAGRRNPLARVVVTGCYAQTAPDEVGKLDGVDLVVGNSEKKELVSLLRELGNGRQVLVSDIMREEHAEGLALQSFAEHTRAFLQVQNGCDAFCSYCIVPYARGRSRSVSLQEVVAGISSFAAQGFKEVVLTGIHLGAYGLDLHPRESLLSLLTMIERQQVVPRLRIGSVEPTEISPELIRFLAGAETICPHLHIPLQSGSDMVLQRMNRNYTGAMFAETVNSLSAEVADIGIGCDLIAGFPGETEAEFRETYRLIERLPLAYLHVFPFSPRPGTPAATMADQVAPAVIKERALTLRRLSERKKQEFHERFIGRELPVLVQGVSGLTRNYLPVVIVGGDAPMNTEVMVRIMAAGPESVSGQLL